MPSHNVGVSVGAENLKSYSILNLTQGHIQYLSLTLNSLKLALIQVLIAR